MEVWAHRGAYEGFNEIENTLPAFRKAAESKADGIELDVRLCGSGEPIVFHDPTLWRMSNVFSVVESTSLDELRERSGIYIPTLEEVLTELKGKTRFILDIKPSSKKTKSDLERKVGRLLKEMPPGDVKISSESIKCLAKFFAIFRGYNLARTNGFRKGETIKCPELCLVLDSKFRPANFATNLLHMDAVHINDSMATRDFFGRPYLRKWKKKGLKVRVWTVNKGLRAQELALQGADGIITDNMSRIYVKR